MVVHACNLKVEAGRFLELTGQPDKSVSSTFSKRMKNILNVDLQHGHAYMHAHTPYALHVNVHTQTQTHKHTHRDTERERM